LTIQLAINYNVFIIVTIRVTLKTKNAVYMQA